MSVFLQLKHQSDAYAWPVPDCHPSGVGHSHQEDQNGHPGAKRSGDRHSQRQGEREGMEWNFQWFRDKEYRETGQNLCVLCLQYVFVSLLSRDNTYKVLMSVCLHLEVGHTSQRQQDIFPFIETHGSLDRQLVPTKPCDCGPVIEPIQSISVGFSRRIRQGVKSRQG